MKRAIGGLAAASKLRGLCITSLLERKGRVPGRSVVESRPFTWRMSAVGRPEIWSFWPDPGQGELGIQGGRETGRSGLSRGGAFYGGGHEIT